MDKGSEIGASERRKKGYAARSELLETGVLLFAKLEGMLRQTRALANTHIHTNTRYVYGKLIYMLYQTHTLVHQHTHTNVCVHQRTHTHIYTYTLRHIHTIYLHVYNRSN